MEEVYVVGGDHHNTLGVLRSLGFKGIKSNLIVVTEKKHPYVGKSRFIKKRYIVPSEEEAINVLINEKPKHEQAVVIACSDGASSEIDLNRNRLEDVYSLPGCKEQGRLTVYMNKSKMTDTANDVGLDTPLSWDADKDTIPSELKYPCITKPILSKMGSKSDISICNNLTELKDALKASHCSKFQIQEFIEKDFEYQLIGLSLNEGRKVIIPGVSHCIRPCPGTNTGYLRYEALEGLNAPIEKCYEFIKTIGYSGLFSIEFLRGKDGHDYFMEMNFRNDGNSICVTKAGYNLPYLWYMANVGQNYQVELDNSTLNPVNVMPEFDDFRFFVLTRKIGLFEWISDIRKTDAFMEYDKQDKAPFYAGINDLLWQKAKRFFTK